jgi:hypothetical protein
VPYRLFHVLDTDDARHGAEDLLLAVRHLGGAVVEHGGAHEVAVLVARHLDGAAVEQHGRALVEGHLDVALDLLDAGPADDGADVDRLVEAGAHLELGGGADELLLELLVDVAHGHEVGAGQAALAAAAEEAGHHVADAAVDLGVGHHGEEVLGAGLRDAALAGGAAALVDVLADGGRRRRTK